MQTLKHVLANLEETEEAQGTFSYSPKNGNGGTAIAITIKPITPPPHLGIAACQAANAAWQRLSFRYLVARLAMCEQAWPADDEVEEIQAHIDGFHETLKSKCKSNE